jgi:hypothetical protein
VVVGFGTVVPDGSLPVFSTDTEEQAKLLLASACETNLKRQYIAKELVLDQTLENLEMFSDRLAEMAERLNLFGDVNAQD